MRSRHLVLAVLLAALLAVGASAMASSSYDLSVENAVSTPEETVDIEGSSFVIDGVGVVQPGDSIAMQVDSDVDYRIFLYNQDEEREYNAGFSADETHVEMGTDDDDLDTADLEPGTYLLSLEPVGEGRQAVFPVVIEGYDLTLEHPQSVDTDEPIELTATVEAGTLESTPEAVTVAIWDGDDVTDVTLHDDGDGAYSSTLEAGSLDSGTYEVYAGVSDDSSSEYANALAIDNGGTLTVSSADDGDDDGGDDSDNGDDDADDSADETDDDTGDDDGDVGNDDDSGDDPEMNESDDEGEDETEAEDDGDDEQSDDSDEVGDEGDTADADADDSEDHRDGSEETDDGDGDDHEDSEHEDDGVIDRNESDSSAEADDDALGVPTPVLIGAALVIALCIRLFKRPPA